MQIESGDGVTAVSTCLFYDTHANLIRSFFSSTGAFFVFSVLISPAYLSFISVLSVLMGLVRQMIKINRYFKFSIMVLQTFFRQHFLAVVYFTPCFTTCLLYVLGT